MESPCTVSPFFPSRPCWPLSLTLATLGGCTPASSGKDAVAPEAPVPSAALKVSVSYRERMLLPPGCTLFVDLINISHLNPEHNGVAGVFVPVKAAPPFRATLRYDPDKVVEQLHYAVAARIELKGQVLFSGSTRLHPLSWPKDKTVEIMVARPPR